MKKRAALNTLRPLKRWPYLLTGLALFAVKYNTDRVIVYASFNRSWYLFDYFGYSDRGSMTASEFTSLATMLVITAFPFVIIGTILTLRRLIDAALPRWMVTIFFVPYINICFFLLLSTLPTSIEVRRDETYRRPWLDRIIPQSKDKAAFVVAVIAAIISVFAIAVTINFSGQYGFSMFLGIPFMQGLAVALLYGYRKERKLLECLGVALTSVIFLSLILLVGAVEGVLCLAMAAPIAIPFALLGGFLGYFIQKRTNKAGAAAMLLLAMLPLAGWVEKQTHGEAPLTSVTTSVIIDRPKQDVWNQLVTFNDIAPPTDMLFNAGIAYPVRAVIEGTGVGSVRRCQFSTGDFIEPITVWDEPKLLRFSVDKMPPPLVELSIYNDLKLPHLEDYFVSERGQFKLTSINEHQTILEGTTWYRHKIWPRLYWQLWSDYILHQIHYQVLNHIKRNAER